MGARSSDEPLGSDVPPPERAPGDRVNRRFRRGLTHPLIWLVLVAPVAAALVLFWVLLWPLGVLAVAAFFGAAGYSFARAFREMRRR